MRIIDVALTLLVVGTAGLGPVQAARPEQKREQADHVLVGTVTALYNRETKGYQQYIVEIRVEKVEKGDGVKKGDTFRAFCYQRKEGLGGLEFDTAGHKGVPRERQRVRVFVNRGGGHQEGVYPDWFDVLPGAAK